MKMPQIPSKKLRDFVIEIQDCHYAVESNGDDTYGWGDGLLSRDLLTKIAELEQAAIAEAEKPKLVWEEINQKGIYASAYYNEYIYFTIWYNPTNFYVESVVNKYPIGLNNHKTFKLACQACEQFLTELLTPTPNE